MDVVQVTQEQYNEFYKSTFKAFDTPLTLSHFSLEGQVRVYSRALVWK
jgi:HSP90 family molecular chaperone